MQNLGHFNGFEATAAVDNPADPSAARADQTPQSPSTEKSFATNSANKGWILNPVLDYLFICGGMVWILYGCTCLGASAIGQDPGSQAYAFILFWGSLLITDAHGPATLMRVFESRTTPKKVRYLVAAWAVILLAVGCFSVTSKDIAQTFVKITLLWGIQHYIAQTFGVVLIYCFKRNFILSSTERFVFQGLMRALMLFVWVRILTVPEYGHIANFMGMEIPFWGPLPPWIVAVAQFVLTLFALAFTSLLAGRLIVKKQLFPIPGLISIISLAAIVMSPRNGFYLLGVCFYHASQYLAITFSYYLKEKALAGEGAVPLNLLPKFFTRRAAFYFAVLVGLGYLSSFTVPLSLIKFGLPDTLALCTVYAVINCHHFLSDALIWRIRDPKVRELLV